MHKTAGYYPNPVASILSAALTPASMISIIAFIFPETD
jgi:hypothetical protein